MIKFLQHSTINKEKWDNCIAASINTLIYAYSWYLDIAAPGWNALIMDDYRAVMPLCHNSKLGVSYIYPPYFVQQLGVFYTSTDDKSLTSHFLNAIPAKYKFIEMYLNTANEVGDTAFEIKAHVTHHLAVNNPYEKIAAAYSDNHKRNLKKAQQCGLEVVMKGNIDDAIQLFRQEKGAHLAKLKNKHYNTLRSIVNTCSNRGLTEFVCVSQQGIVQSILVFLITDGKAIFIFSGSNSAAKLSGAMTFGMDYFIRTHAGEALLLDFEGSNHEGLARFYRGFGATVSTYYLVRKNLLPPPIKWLK